MPFEPVRFLEAEDVTFERMPHGDLRVYCGGETYSYVKAIRTHPTSDPQRYISLRARVVSANEKDSKKETEVEIGVLRDLRALPKGARKLVEEALARRYLVHTVMRISALREEFGFLYWDVETDRGPRSFTSPRWNQNHVIEMGPRGEGRIVFDVYNNRYLIPDLEALDDRSRRLFRRFIYW